MKPKFLSVLFLAFLSLNTIAQSPKIKKQKIAEFTVNTELEQVKFDAWVWKKPLRIKTSNSKTYYWYKSNAVMTTNGGYDGKVLHGNYVSFYLNNNLKEKGKINKGLKYGQWKNWYDNGNMKEISSWKKGAKTGNYSVYTETGKLLETGTFKNGIKHGFVKTYAADTVFSQVRFKNGVPHLEVKLDKRKKEEKDLNDKSNDSTNANGDKKSQKSLKKSQEEKAKSPDVKKKEAGNSDKIPFSEKLKKIFGKKDKAKDGEKK